VSRQEINRIGAIAPVVLSLLAFGLVIVAVATGWGMDMKDEGAATHIFHLLIALLIPLMLAFLATADWRRFGATLFIVSIQVVALALAFGPVHYFRL
jgi:cell division protein FtsW (lipid II flippase)